MPQTYTFASWNVNGLRAVLKKDPSFIQIAQELDVDILALQETKLQEGQVQVDLPGYHQTWSYAERKGYSGTAVFSRQEPLRVLRADALLPYAGEGEAAELVAQAATEGRVCALEFDKFWFVDVYTPNAQNELARIDVRMAWDDAYRDFLSALEHETGKPVVTCGDFNVAHEEIDLKNPKSNRGNAGFSDEERGKFTELLNAGFTDTWRAANPDVEGVYSWWSYRFNARKNNAGWRIDYFLVSDAIADNVRDAGIRGDNSILQKEGVVDYNYAPADDLPDDVDFDGDASWMGSVAAAAAIGTGAAIVAYQFGTTVYLDSVLPEGADIPVTYGQLAKLMWQNAGSPEPETALAPDADEVQKAMAWAVENELIDAHRKADFLVSRVSVIRAWNKAQKLAAAK